MEILDFCMYRYAIHVLVHDKWSRYYVHLKMAEGAETESNLLPALDFVSIPDYEQEKVENGNGLYRDQNYLIRWIFDDQNGFLYLYGNLTWDKDRRSFNESDFVKHTVKDPEWWQYNLNTYKLNQMTTSKVTGPVPEEDIWDWQAEPLKFNFETSLYNPVIIDNSGQFMIQFGAGDYNVQDRRLRILVFDLTKRKVRFSKIELPYAKMHFLNRVVRCSHKSDDEMVVQHLLRPHRELAEYKIECCNAKEENKRDAKKFCKDVVDMIVRFTSLDRVLLFSYQPDSERNSAGHNVIAFEVDIDPIIKSAFSDGDDKWDRLSSKYQPVRVKIE